MKLLAELTELQARYVEVTILYQRGFFDPRPPPPKWEDGRPPVPLPPQGPTKRPWEMEGYREARVRAGLSENRSVSSLDYPGSLFGSEDEDDDRPVWGEEGYEIEEDENTVVEKGDREG